MSTIVAFANDAGSAGKTTSAVTLATLLGQAGKRTLLVDLDKQANATCSLGIEPGHNGLTIGSVLLRESTLEQATVATEYEGLDLVPSSESIKVDELTLAKKIGKEMQLRQALAKADHDVVILDCQAGATDFWPLSALIAARWLVSVTLPSSKELQGLPRIEATVREVADAYNPDLELGGIIPCSVPAANRGRAYSDAMAVLRAEYGELVSPPVRQSVTAVSAYSFGEPLPYFAPSDPITEDYRAVLAHLIARGVF